jgi:hypothetical protein
LDIESGDPCSPAVQMNQRIEINLFFEAGLYMMLYASSAGGL